jgi:lipoprotein-anchoring transpeptidase ErfK/SrfK
MTEVLIDHPRSAARRTAALAVACLSLVALLADPSDLTAQSRLNGHGLLGDDRDQVGPDVVFQDRILEREYASEVPLMEYDGRYIVVHIAENRVFVFEGGRAIWSAPAGTGTGFRLETANHRWKFTTPRGLMKVRRMEKDPVWEAPDWHYLEKGLAPPPYNSPRRRIRGGMGNTALYLGDGIAIHGTWSPQLLLNPDPEARRVSHGCIRLTDEHARELMHMVEVGTPVLIF